MLLATSTLSEMKTNDNNVIWEMNSCLRQTLMIIRISFAQNQDTVHKEFWKLY